MNKENVKFFYKSLIYQMSNMSWKKTFIMTIMLYMTTKLPKMSINKKEISKSFKTSKWY